jgi:hypothetical protein
MDYAGLKGEIAKAQYAGMTDNQIASALEVPITVAIDVSTSAVEGYFRARLMFGALSKFIASPPSGAPAELVEGVSEFLGLVQSPHTTVIYMTDAAVASAVQQTISGLVSLGILTQAFMDSLMALAAQTTTRAAQLGFSADVHDMVQEILAARRWE